MTSETSEDHAVEPARTRSAPRRWWLALAVPAVGLLEATTHVVQAGSHIAPGDWQAAKSAVVDALRGPNEGSGLIIAPRWAEPTARAAFGREIATLERMAPGDFQRYRRVVELSVRGEAAAEVASWPVVEQRVFGKLAVRIRTNPGYELGPEHSVVDLLSMFDRSRVSVSAAGADCGFSQSGTQTGNLGFGPAVPGERFNCPGGALAGLTVIADLAYRPRRCVLVRPGTEAAPLRVVFHDAPMGKFLVGHHGLYAEHERNLDGAPIVLEVRVNDQLVGRDTHIDGQAWKEFRFPTASFPHKANIEFALSSAAAGRRAYCFEATTRGAP